MIALFIAAILLLPITSAFTWRSSKVASVALGIATLACAYWIASLLFGVMPWTGIKWLVAWSTGMMGAFELRLDGVPKKLGALLVGSSCADMVALYREAHGEEFGVLPVMQIVVLLTMLVIVTPRKGSVEQLEGKAQAQSLRETF